MAANNKYERRATRCATLCNGKGSKTQHTGLCTYVSGFLCVSPAVEGLRREDLLKRRHDTVNRNLWTLPYVWTFHVCFTVSSQICFKA